MKNVNKYEGHSITKVNLWYCFLFFLFTWMKFFLPIKTKSLRVLVINKNVRWWSMLQDWKAVSYQVFSCRRVQSCGNSQKNVNCVCKAQSPKFHFLRSFVNSVNYRKLLKQVRKNIKNKRRGHQSKTAILHHDNARPHTAAQTVQNISNLGWELLPLLLYSPSFAPSNFHLFGPLKEFTRGTKFERDNKVKVLLATGCLKVKVLLVKVLLATGCLKSKSMLREYGSLCTNGKNVWN